MGRRLENNKQACVTGYLGKYVAHKTFINEGGAYCRHKSPQHLHVEAHELLGMVSSTMQVFSCTAMTDSYNSDER